MIETHTIVDNRVALKLKSDLKAVLLCKIIELSRLSKLVDIVEMHGMHWIYLKFSDFQNFIPYKSAALIEKAIIELEDKGYVFAIRYHKDFAFRPSFVMVAQDFPYLILETDSLAYEKPVPKILADRKRRKLKIYPTTEEDKALARAWIENAMLQKHSREQAAKWDSIEFAQDLYKARESVGITDQQMKQVFLFMIDDDFWKDKCLVPKFLMKKGSNGRTKIANLVSAWQSSLHVKSKGFSYLRENHTSMTEGVIDTTSTSSKTTGQEEDIDLFG